MKHVLFTLSGVTLIAGAMVNTRTVFQEMIVAAIVLNSVIFFCTGALVNAIDRHSKKP